MGLGSGERRGFKTSFDTLTLTNYSKELLSSIDMFVCWDGIVAGFTSSCLVAP